MTPAGRFQYLLLLGDYKYAQVKHCAAQFYVSHSISSRVSQNKLKFQIYKLHLVLQYLTIISISHIRQPCYKLCIALQFQNSLLARNSFVQKVDFSHSSVLGQKTKNIRSTRIWKNQSSVLNCTRIYPDKRLIKSRIKKSYTKAKLISHKKIVFLCFAHF
jgi:hypothetical protein